jgi:hypothetical protein
MGGGTTIGLLIIGYVGNTIQPMRAMMMRTVHWITQPGDRDAIDVAIGRAGDDPCTMGQDRGQECNLRTHETKPPPLPLPGMTKPVVV